MTDPSAELIQRCRTLGAQLNMAVVSFRMQPVSVDTVPVAPSGDSAERNAAIQAKYEEMEAAAKANWRAQFSAELDAVCDALAQSGTAPPLPPMDWDVQSMNEIAVILATIKL